jgi:hypothetical protein
VKEDEMSDMRDPYGRQGRPGIDPYTSHDSGGPGWGWIAGIAAVALIVAFFAFGSNTFRTAQVTSDPPAAAQRAPLPGSGPNTIVPPTQPQPAPKQP